MTITEPGPPAITGLPGQSRGIHLGRITAVEARKMLDTRSAFWLTSSVGMIALLAMIALTAFVDARPTYSSFVAAIGIPSRLVLPILGILSVTSEWSQRTGLTSFIMVPNRGRVLGAKAVASVGLAVAPTAVSFGIGALGTVAASATRGLDPTWDLTVTNLLTIVVGNVLGMLMGFTIGVLVRGSAAALAAYAVYQILLPALAAPLATSQGWFHGLRPWIDADYAQSALYSSGIATDQWVQIGVTGLIWMAIPLAVGLPRAMRAEVR